MTPEHCPWCEEPVEPGEAVLPAAVPVTVCDEGGARRFWQHAECALRSAAGSVGHQRSRCSCFGGDEEDPPGLSKREAAQAAALLFRQGENRLALYLRTVAVRGQR